MSFKTLSCALAVTALFATSAAAQIAEVRIGLTEFDEETTGINWGAGGGAENSIGINAEIVFDAVIRKDKPFSVHPYFGGMVNLSGDTSYAGAGILLRQDFSDKFYGDIGIGLALHDGTINAFDEGFARGLRRARNEISFGSSILFRPHITLGYRFTDKWAGEVYMDHLSNGMVFGDTDLNQGVDNLGIRVARRF